MKITHNKIGQNLNLTDSSKTDKASGKEKTSGVGKADNSSALNDLKDLGASGAATRIDLSQRAHDLKQIKDVAMNSTPDVDMAKVEKFRNLIDQGKYKTDSKAIADRMVDEHLFAAGASSNE